MNPEVSVVIPSYNRKHSLQRLLEALGRQDSPAYSFEVIVVLDGSTDGSAEVLAELSTPFALRVINEVNAGAGAARNAGVAVARAPYCLFLDDDMTPEPGVVREHLSAQRASGGVLGVGAIVMDAFRRGLPQQFKRFWADYHARREAGIPLRFVECFTGNLSLPVAAFHAVGGFDPTFRRGEDVELAYRLKASGLELVYVAGAVAHSEYLKTTVEALRDDRAGGAAAVRMLEKYPPAALLHYVTSPAGRDPLYAELVRLAVRLPVPEPLVRVLGNLSPRIPGVSLLFGFMRTRAHMAGARSAITEDATWDALTTGVRILMYHAFAQDGEAASRYVATAREFREQMAWLKRWGANIIPLSEYVAMREAGALPPRFTVVITIDDAYRETASLAAPLLKQLAIPWTLFVAGALPPHNRWDTAAPLGGRALLTRSDVSALADGGCEIGAHGQTHRNLRGLPSADLLFETNAPRKALQHALGAEVTLFSYPFGASDEASRQAAEAAGYTAAVGVRDCAGTSGRIAGPHSDSFAIPRIAVPGGLALWQFKCLVRWGRLPPLSKKH